MTVASQQRKKPHGSDLLNEFREIDGSMNNNLVEHFNLTAGSEELRITEPYYAPCTINGLIEGPDPRTISNLLSGGDRAEVADTTSSVSGWSYVFGQFIDHDISRTSTSGGDDISMTLFGDPTAPDGTTISLSRANVSEDGFAINSVTGWLDGSQIYGSDAETAASLRSNDGHMLTSEGNNLPIDEDGNFFAGDIRVMENPQLSGITTIFVREHNFQVDRLASVHPEWTGDQLYEMAKAITTAELQNAVYNEYLPSILGSNTLSPYTGYNPHVDPRIMQEFSNAAFRFGHSTVSDEQTKIDEFGNIIEEQTLAQAMQDDVAARIANGGLDALVRAVSSDGANNVDTGAVDGLRDTMTGPDSLVDLIAVDIQRQRDLGLGTFNDTREALSLEAYASFDDLTDDPSLVADLEDLYGSINNLDLFIGGLAEKHAPGSTMGETFTTVIATQFENLRDGDRYYWENQGFDTETTEMISNATLSNLLLRNTDTDAIQANSFFEAQRHASDVAPEDPVRPQLVIGIDRDAVEIVGGPNNDTIVDGAGDWQILHGGGGADTFIFGDSGQDNVDDFDTTFDHIQFTGDAASDASATIRNVGGGSELAFNGHTITLYGVSADQMSQGNLTFTDANAMTTQHGLTVIT